MTDGYHDNAKRNVPASFDDGGFAGYTDEIAYGDEQQQNPRLIQGVEVSFTNDSRWVDGNDEALPPGLRVVPAGVKRVVQKWLPGNSGPPVETITLEAHQPFPDVKEMNNKCPESEWGTDLNGKPRGPWQIARVLYLIDPQTLDQYTFIATNIGSTRAVDDLVNKIRWVQKHRGPDVLPLLQFSTTWMPTRYGGRMRPHFQIVDWTRPNGGGSSNALEPRTPPTLPSPAAAEPAQTSAQTSASAQNPPPQKPSPQKPAPARKKPTAALELKGGIKEPSLKEDLDDEIPL